MRVGRLLAVSTFLAALAVAPMSSAFCGFYVSGADTKLFNNATQVVLLRDGTRTVLSMQNDYEGPPEGFALVIPVPVVLQKENVKTLSKDVFDRVDKMTAPRLVEYWEQDPCGGYGYASEAKAAAPMARAAGPGGGGGGRAADLGVKVEAQFDVGEYDIVILSAKDSTGLDTYLREEKYKIPAGSEPYLRPYVQSGSKFFVAKVDPKRVKFENGHAALSPIRFHYDSNDFSLPVRLGLVNSRGTQDLVVNILAKERYEPANYPSVTIPTNIDLAEGSKEHFGRFYTALYDKTLEKTPKAIVTEYSWAASSCDPCPGPALNWEDFAKLGADALPDATPGNPNVQVQSTTGTASASSLTMVPKRYQARVAQCWNEAHSRDAKNAGGRVEVKVAWGVDGKVKSALVTANDKELGDCIAKPFLAGQMPPEDANITINYQLGVGMQAPYKQWTLTRLHARYTKESLGEDIVFKKAPAITGGREVRNEKKELEHGATVMKDAEGSANNFQGRYAIRHPWVGPIECKEPQRGQWGGPWPDPNQAYNPWGWGYQQPPVEPIQKVAFAPRGGADLSDFVRSDVGELGIKAGKGPLPAKLAALSPSASAAAPAGTTPVTNDTSPETPKSSKGACGCSLSDRSPAWPALFAALAGVVAVTLRRRRTTK